MMRRASLCAVVLLTMTAAWSESVYWWDSREMVERIGAAESIVVGHVAGEISLLTEAQRQGTEFCCRGRLAVDEVLKGPPLSGETRFLLSYDINPAAYVRDGELVDAPWRGEHPASALLQITGDLALTDCHKPAVWVLTQCEVERPASGTETTDEFGVLGRNAVQPIVTKPFFEAAIRDAPAEELIGFLDSKEPSVRALALRYLTGAGVRSAFPKVAELLGDEEMRDGSLAIEACTYLGGRASLPYLRPLLDAEDEETVALAAEALAILRDSGSVPRMIELLAEANAPSMRNGIAHNLADLHDPRAIPALVAALRDDRFEGQNYWPRAWEGVRGALREITGCSLSRNGDKAERWWAVAKNLDEEAWKHFATAELIRGLTAMGPSDHEVARCNLRPLDSTVIYADAKTWNLSYFHGRGHYDPAAAQVQWLAWLDKQGWDDWQAMPSQVDDELQLTVEPTATLDSGEPVHLRYTIRNVSDRDIWLCKRYDEVPSIWFAGGIGVCSDYDSAPGWCLPPELPTEDEFFRIPAGESRFVIGERAIYNVPGGDRDPRPRSIVPGLGFYHTGTTLSLDAWVGEVWADEIKFPVEPGYGQN